MWDSTMHMSINIPLHQYDKSHNVSEIIYRVTLASDLGAVTQAFVELYEDNEPRSTRTYFHRDGKSNNKTALSAHTI